MGPGIQSSSKRAHDLLGARRRTALNSHRDKESWKGSPGTKEALTLIRARHLIVHLRIAAVNVVGGLTKSLICQSCRLVSRRRSGRCSLAGLEVSRARSRSFDCCKNIFSCTRLSRLPGRLWFSDFGQVYRKMVPEQRKQPSPLLRSATTRLWGLSSGPVRRAMVQGWPWSSPSPSPFPFPFPSSWQPAFLHSFPTG